MAILPIIWAPDPVLKTRCAKISGVDADIRRLMDDMLETMYAAPGVGLAAPQVGVSRRVIVVDCARPDEEPRPIRMANPELLTVSEDEAINEEGCLSLPSHYADVTRSAGAKIRYLDEVGVSRVIETEGLLATCIQHEIDHLNGILFVDHLSALKRNMILKKMVKAKKERHLEPAD
jgi:peptide deformylase